MKFIQSFFAFYLMAFMFNSCGHYPCGDASSHIGLVNFAQAETDTIIVRRFAKGSSFAAFHDSMMITQSNANLQRQHDTLLVLSSFNDGKMITSDYDFEIYLPQTNNVYKISDIKEDILYGSKTGQKVYCINPITSYKLNGELIKVDPRYQPIYLTK